MDTILKSIPFRIRLVTLITAILIPYCTWLYGRYTRSHPPFHFGVLAGVIAGLATILQILLALFGLNSFYLIYCAMTNMKHHSLNDEKLSPVDSLPPRSKHSKQSPHVIQQDLFAKNSKENFPWPFVTIQAPIYNERFMIHSLLQALVKIDYPLDKFEIQVLDDSTDDTPEIVREEIKRLSKDYPSVKIHHLWRSNRVGYKAGAMAEGMKTAKGEFIGVFDADFNPSPDFLKLTLPSFYQNDAIGCVQTRWGHSNFEQSLFVKLQAISHDGHFVIEQFGKFASGLFFNFNGTGGIWRASCILDSGNWQSDTLAEDLDLSYRAQLRGWKVHYLRGVVVPAEIPLQVSAFKKQQARWARGSLQCAVKLTPRVWDSDFPLRTKIMATIHLWSYIVHPLMFLNLIFTIILFFIVPGGDADYVLMLTMILAIGPPLVVAMAQMLQGHMDRMYLMLPLLFLHHGLCVSNTIAATSALTLPSSSFEFERTPKYGDTLKGGWSSSTYAKSITKMQHIPWIEIVFAIFLMIIMIYGYFADLSRFSFPWLLFFTFGFIFIVSLQYIESWEEKPKKE